MRTTGPYVRSLVRCNAPHPPERTSHASVGCPTRSRANSCPHPPFKFLPPPPQVLPLVAQSLAHLEGLLVYAAVFAALCADMEAGVGADSGETGELGWGGSSGGVVRGRPEVRTGARFAARTRERLRRTGHMRSCDLSGKSAVDTGARARKQAPQLSRAAGRLTSPTPLSFFHHLRLRPSPSSHGLLPLPRSPRPLFSSPPSSNTHQPLRRPLHRLHPTPPRPLLSLPHPQPRRPSSSASWTPSWPAWTPRPRPARAGRAPSC